MCSLICNELILCIKAREKRLIIAVSMFQKRGALPCFCVLIPWQVWVSLWWMNWVDTSFVIESRSLFIFTYEIKMFVVCGNVVELLAQSGQPSAGSQWSSVQEHFDKQLCPYCGYRHGISQRGPNVPARHPMHLFSILFQKYPGQHPTIPPVLLQRFACKVSIHKKINCTTFTTNGDDFIVSFMTR